MATVNHAGPGMMNLRVYLPACGEMEEMWGTVVHVDQGSDLLGVRWTFEGRPVGQSSYACEKFETSTDDQGTYLVLYLA